MRFKVLIIVSFFVSVFSLLLSAQTNTVIDHHCTDIYQIPAQWINTAKSDIKIRYYHTSHGSHVEFGGMLALTNYSPAYAQTYSFNETGTGGALKLVTIWNNDLSANEDNWDDITRDDLNSDPNCNVVMWSWCNIYNHNISDYLQKMETLIGEYGPGGSRHRANPVTFVFMTGHSNGGIGSQTENQWTYNANKTIRDYCAQNNRWLFDFNDIECWDPDGTYFGDGNPLTGAYVGQRLLNDDCSYTVSGSTRGNWGIEWMNDNPSAELSLLAQNSICENCVHSGGDEAGKDNSRLHCVLKGQAAWWLWARLAGWNPSNTTVPVTQIIVRGFNNATTITTPGGTLQMIADVLPADASNKSVQWSIQNITGQAAISSFGLLTAHANGTVRAVATATDGSGITGTLIITLSNQLILVNDISVTSINGNTIFDIASGTIQMIADVSPANASNKSVNWILYNNESEASITSDGLVTFLNPGEVNVVAVANDGSGEYGYCTIEILNDYVYVDSIIVRGHNNTDHIELPDGTLQMEATIHPGNATNDSLVWSLVNETGSATLDENCLLHAQTDGIVRVIASATDGSGVYGEVSIAISGQSAITGFPANPSEDNVIIYPNPASDVIYIKNNTAGNIYYTITSMEGRIIIQSMIFDANTAIDVSKIRTGFYLIDIQYDDSQIIRKVLINR